jgi:hypothetical protein
MTLFTLKVWQVLGMAVILAALIVLGVSSIFSAKHAEADLIRVTCESLGSNAQHFFDTNPERGARLDRDRDGKACEANYN